MGDCLQDFGQTVQLSCPQINTLLLYLDKGPENHARRTQFMQRLTAFAETAQVTLQFAS